MPIVLLLLGCTCLFTFLLTVQPSRLPSWMPTRYLEVYQAWVTLNLSHRYEVQQLESSFGIFGIPVALTHQGSASNTLRSLWDAAKASTNLLSIKQYASQIKALKM